MGMTVFWVIGGAAKEGGSLAAVRGTEKWIGPFEDYESAKKEWSKHSWQALAKNATRYRIEGYDPDTPPLCTD